MGSRELCQVALPGKGGAARDGRSATILGAINLILHLVRLPSHLAPGFLARTSFDKFVRIGIDWRETGLRPAVLSVNRLLSLWL